MSKLGASKKKMKEKKKITNKLKDIVKNPQFKLILKEFKEDVYIHQWMQEAAKVAKESRRSSLNPNFASEDPKELLMNVIHLKKHELVDKFLEKNPGLLTQECENRLPIFHALEVGSGQIIKLLIEKYHASLDVYDNGHHCVRSLLGSALFHLYDNEIAILGYLLKNDIPRDRLNSEGDPLLMDLLKPFITNLNRCSPDRRSFCIEAIELLEHYGIETNIFVSGKPLCEYIRSSGHYAENQEFYERIIAAINGVKGLNFQKNLAGDWDDNSKVDNRDSEVDKLSNALEAATFSLNSSNIDTEMEEPTRSLHFNFLSNALNHRDLNQQSSSNNSKLKIEKKHRQRIFKN